MTQGSAHDINDQRARSGPARRGFAAMRPELQREIARRGGQASAKGQRRDAQGQFAGARSAGSTGPGGRSSGTPAAVSSMGRPRTPDHSHMRAADRDRRH